MGTRPRTRLGDNYESLGNKESTEPLRPRSAFSVACTATLCRPLRIFQFLTILLLFALVIFMTAKSATAKPIHISHPASILLIILTASYLFFIAIDMISQFGGHGLPDSPMFLFSFLGVVLFAIAGGLMVHYRDPEDHLWALLLSQILCFIVSILFLIEITMLIGYWRQRCLSWKRCYPYTPAGTCGQREMKTIFTRDAPRDVDIELGRCDLATSVSRCGIPLETSADSAVEEHGCRKIGIGHRRQYVDCHSSVPALAIVQIAQIQTETGPTSITESQTARTEMIESIVQTTSRCELCNRQMEAAPATPYVSSPSPSSMSQSRYPSQIETQMPQLQAPQLPVETTPYNVPQSPSPSPQVQLGNCALCPAFYHMVRGGIPIGASPCCQSCSCGVKTPEQSRQVVPYLLDQSSQRLQSGSQSDWPQRQASTATMTKAPIENDSDTATAVTTERSEIEHLVVDETDRYRPIRKLPRVYETRPCPTHGAGLAARMAGLPETVTKVTLPSICIRRNKRTQTPAKKSAQIEGEADKPKEDPVDPRSFVDKPDRYKSGDSKVSTTSIRSERNELTNRTLSDVRVRMLSDEEMRRRSRVGRTSGYSSPIKRIRDSEILLEETELELPEKTDQYIDGSETDRMSSMIKPEPSGKLIWQSDRSEPRISVPMGKEVTWLRENFAIKEEPDVDWDVEESRKSSERIQRESRIKFREEPDTPEGSELNLRDDEPSDSGSSRIIKKGSGKISRTSSQASRQRSRTGSTSRSRLGLDKSGEDPQESKRRVGESSGSIPRSRSRSRSGMRPSKAASEVPSVSTSRNVSKGRLSKADSEISPASRSRSRTEERLSKEDSKTPSESKVRLSKKDLGTSSASITRASKEQRSKMDLDTPLESKGRLSREDSEVSSRSMIGSSKDRQSRIDSDMPDSRVRLSKKASEISSGSMTRGSKEQRSEMDSDTPLESKSRLSREDSEISSRSMIGSSKDRQSRIGSDMPDSKLRLSKKDSEISSGSMTRASKEQRSKTDLDTPLESKGRLSREGSEISSRSMIRDSKDRQSRTDSDMPGSKVQLSREYSDVSSGSMTKASKEQRSKTNAYMQLESKGRLRREDSETLSRSTIRDSRDRQSRMDSDMPGSKVQLSREHSEISSGSMIKSGSKNRPSKADTKTPSDSKTGMKDSELRLERSIEDYGSSRGSLTREASEISSGSMIERLSRADGSETPSESRTVIEEQLLRLEKPEDRAGSHRRVGESDLSIPPTRSQSTSRGLPGETRSPTPSGSTVRKDDFSEPSIGKRRSERGSALVGSPGSRTSAISQERSIRTIEEDISSYSDWPAGQRKSSDRETPSSPREFIEKSEDDDHSRDIEGWREELDEELEADESLIFASSSKVSRTKPKKERSSRMGESDETPGRSSTQQKIPGRSAERSPDASRSGSPRRRSRKQKGASRELAYAPAPWSSKGNVLQSRSRIEPPSRIEFDQTGIPDCDPYTGMGTGLPVPDCPPVWQCIENPECTISGIAMDYDCPPSVCTHESTCVDPCSCRLKSILLHQGSIAPRGQPVRCLTAEQSAIINCDTEAPRRQCPMRELRCNRGMLAWAARRKQQPPGEDRISRSRDTNRRMTFNLCYVS